MYGQCLILFVQRLHDKLLDSKLLEFEDTNRIQGLRSEIILNETNVPTFSPSLHLSVHSPLPPG